MFAPGNIFGNIKLGIYGFLVISRGMIFVRKKTEMVWARHEDGRRSRSEESNDESDTGEKEERETKDKVEGCVQEGHADCRTERGRWRRQGLLERDDQQP